MGRRSEYGNQERGKVEELRQEDRIYRIHGIGRTDSAGARRLNPASSGQLRFHSYATVAVGRKRWAIPADLVSLKVGRPLPWPPTFLFRKYQCHAKPEPMRDGKQGRSSVEPTFYPRLGGSLALERRGCAHAGNRPAFAGLVLGGREDTPSDSHFSRRSNFQVSSPLLDPSRSSW